MHRSLLVGRLSLVGPFSMVPVHEEKRGNIIPRRNNVQFPMSLELGSALPFLGWRPMLGCMSLVVALVAFISCFGAPAAWTRFNWFSVSLI